MAAPPWSGGAGEGSGSEFENEPNPKRSQPARQAPAADDGPAHGRPAARFVPSYKLQDVPEGTALPPGLYVHEDPFSGRTQARFMTTHERAHGVTTPEPAWGPAARAVDRMADDEPPAPAAAPGAAQECRRTAPERIGRYWRTDPTLVNLEVPAIAELARLQQWVVWIGTPKTDRNGKVKINKTPYCIGGKRPASTTDSRTWDAYGPAWASVVHDPHVDGLGIVFTPHDGLAGVDLDDCRDWRTGEITRDAQRWIDRFDTYTEVSPTKTGVKIFMRAVLPGGKGRKNGTCEIYDRGRYFAVTGDHLPGAPGTIEERQDAALEFLAWLDTGGTTNGTAQPGGAAHIDFRHADERVDLGGDDDPRWRSCPEDVRLEVDALLASDPAGTIAAAWAMQGVEPVDTSRSGWMARLAALLRNLGWDADWIAGALVLFCEHHGFPDKLGREVKRACELVVGRTPWGGDAAVWDHAAESLRALGERLREASGPGAGPGPGAGSTGPTGAGTGTGAGTSAGATSGGAPSWPEPLDIFARTDLTGWPVISADCLPAPLLEFALAEGERMGVDPVAVANHAIAACSASISDKWSYTPKRRGDTYAQQARIWSCNVKDVAQRGSAILEAAAEPLVHRNEVRQEEHRILLAAWTAKMEGLTKAEKAEAKKRDPAPAFRNVWTHDATIEGARDRLAEGRADGRHDKLAIIADELVGFFGSFGMYTSGGGAASARAKWLETYDGGPKTYNRSERTSDASYIHIPNWSVTISGNIQDRRLAELAPKLTADGLFQRFSTIVMRPEDPTHDDDPKVDPEVGARYRELHQALVRLEPLPCGHNRFIPLTSSPEAREVRARLMRFARGLKADASLPYFVRECVGKWSGHHTRLCLVFHLIWVAEQLRAGRQFERFDEWQHVSGETAAMAAEWLRRVILPNLMLLSTRYMHEENEVHEHAAWIAGHILSYELAAITSREVRRAYGKLRGKPKEVDAAMHALADADWVRRTQNRSNSQTWEVNPLVKIRFAATSEREREQREKVKAAIRAAAEERRNATLNHE